MNIYVDLTREFNRGKLRAILSSGQAVVLHRLAVMSKDGDWILRENPSDLDHVLCVLASHGAHYRFGAPLDERWLSGGWSSHFEFQCDRLRVRADFVTRPPRISAARLAAMWLEQDACDLPFVKACDLAELKKTNREKDYAVIGELARMLRYPAEQILLSRSARDLILLAEQHPGLVERLVPQRPVLATIGRGLAELEAGLDAERRALMHMNERRLENYLAAAQRWTVVWTELADEVAGLPLPDAHRIIVSRAVGVLPFSPAGVVQ